MKHTWNLRLFHSTEEMQYHLEINHLNDNGLIFQHDNNPKDTANVGKAYLDRIECHYLEKHNVSVMTGPKYYFSSLLCLHIFLYTFQEITALIFSFSSKIWKGSEGSMNGFFTLFCLYETSLCSFRAAWVKSFKHHNLD